MLYGSSQAVINLVVNSTSFTYSFSSNPTTFLLCLAKSKEEYYL